MPRSVSPVGPPVTACTTDCTSPSARPRTRCAIEVMGSRPRSPSAYSVDRWGPQAEGPGPAKRRRTNEPSDPESEAASSPDNLTRPRAADARTSVVVLDADCALYLPLDDVDLVLEPEATSVQRVSLRDHTVMVVPETLLASVTECLGGQGHSSLGLEQGALLSAPGEYIALEQGFFYGSVPEIAAQEEVYEEDVDAEFLPPGMEAAAGSVAGLRSPARRASDPDMLGLVPEPSPRASNPSPETCSPYQGYNLDFHLLEPLPDSPLQPLPPSPNPAPHQRPQRPHGPARKAQRCLFPESVASLNSSPPGLGAGQSLMILVLCILPTGQQSQQAGIFLDAR
ncbi:proline-rich protein 23C-like [Camelus ferus]|uniref:Proline-rich protein 23C-like n=2 Tax=Camelus TaxID=9836 RepID=A0A8B8TD30_CAMFR|nr:proline-rich protein 23C-like [Camelus bactrianus]XP_032340146.1 proline-rich protein 23C-like [Camelus ferus]